MNYSFKIYKQVEKLFLENELLGATQISTILGVSRAIIHKVLKGLLEEDKVEKIGKGSHVKYSSLIYFHDEIADISNASYEPNYKIKKKIEEVFYKFNSDGSILAGFDGMQVWCKDRGLNIEEKANNYIKINDYVESIQNSCGLLEATKIFRRKFPKLHMDKVFYSDEYNYMEFGRGKLAEMTFYAKQSQNIKLINDSIDEIIFKLECLIKAEKIDAIAITPWSIDRKNQILAILKNRLEKYSSNFINIIKYYPNNIAIPQKSLKTRDQRIKNATNTIFVRDKDIKNYSKILLIDDFVGSGATLNITAEKLKSEGIKEIIGFSFVGSMDLSYEVINEI